MPLRAEIDRQPAATRRKRAAELIQVEPEVRDYAEVAAEAKANIANIIAQTRLQLNYPRARRFPLFLVS